jgi:hypothetical protein
MSACLKTYTFSGADVAVGVEDDVETGADVAGTLDVAGAGVELLQALNIKASTSTTATTTNHVFFINLSSYLFFRFLVFGAANYLKPDRIHFKSKMFKMRGYPEFRRN